MPSRMALSEWYTSPMKTYYDLNFTHIGIYELNLRPTTKYCLIRHAT